MTDMNAELEAAIAELIREVEATATYYRQASNPSLTGEGWVTDVHGETADVVTVEAAADELEQRLPKE